MVYSMPRMMQRCIASQYLPKMHKIANRGHIKNVLKQQKVDM